MLWRKFTSEVAHHPTLSVGAMILNRLKIISELYRTNNTRKVRFVPFSSTTTNCHAQTKASSATTHYEKENIVFDNHLKNLQRDGAARSYKCWREKYASSSTHKTDDFVDYDYIYREIALRLVDRLDDIKREQGFPLALDIGSGPGHLFKVISSEDALNDIGGGIGGIQKIVELDSSNEMLHRDVEWLKSTNKEKLSSECNLTCQTYKMKWLQEDILPFPDETFDLVLSCAAMHRVNHLPQLFNEIKRILKPDGCFLAAMIGGSSLPELRAALLLAESERDGGVSPRVGPFVDVADVGRLLSSAGFALPTVDVDTLRLSYPNAMVLMEHLQRMGESNVCIERKFQRTNLDTFLASACLYENMFSLGTNEVEATVQVIYSIGWVPHDSQPKPKARGSATRRIGETIT